MVLEDNVCLTRIISLVGHHVGGLEATEYLVEWVQRNARKSHGHVGFACLALLGAQTIPGFVARTT